MNKADVVICGAGIAGVATAYHLTLEQRRDRIVIVDGHQPLSFTTSSSGENFRDYWPQPCMASLMGDSIGMMMELSHETANSFDLVFSGYDFVSEIPDRDIFPSKNPPDALSACKLLREANHKSLRSRYPYLSDSVAQVLHIENAGAFDVQAFGSLLLQRARRNRLEFVQAMVSEIRHRSAGGFELELCRDGSKEFLLADRLVLAAGPFTGDLAAMLDVHLPIENFLQRKVVIPDPLNVIPRSMPFTVFADSQRLEWTAEDIGLIASDPEFHWLLDEFPAGLHIKPVSSGRIKLGWAYNRTAERPKREHHDELYFPDVVVRGASRFIPGLKSYLEQMPTPAIQLAGYYSRTAENWPLIGPLGVDGAFTVSALSGYGTMAAAAAGALCSAWVTGAPLPHYARHFHPERMADPEIVAEIRQIENDGQL